MIEVAASSTSCDLHQKLPAYRRNGVQEHLVHRVEDREVDWFALERGAAHVGATGHAALCARLRAPG